MYFDSQVLIKCINDNSLKDVSSKNNHAYQIIIGEKTINVLLLEVIPNYFKIIPAGVIWEVLKNYEWHYYNGEVCTLVSSKETKNPKYKGNEAFAKSDYQIHHKWFRAVALRETITLMPDKTHKMWHQVVGHYARNQKIVIGKEEDFYQFIGELQKVRTILAERVFGLEF